TCPLDHVGSTGRMNRSFDRKRRDRMNPQRRGALKAGGGLGIFGMLAAAGVIAPGSALARDAKLFEAETLEDAFKALGIERPELGNEVTLIAPDIAENGAVVPVGVSTDLPGVEVMSILVEENPNK